MVTMDIDALPEYLRLKIEVSEGGHWLWMGGRNKGYGVAHVPNKRTTEPAYRAVYKALVGPIPEDHHLDHLCRVPPCCNPSHVEPVTPGENTRRAAAFRTRCKWGHLLDRTDYRGYRYCRPCRAAYARKRRLRLKGKST